MTKAELKKKLDDALTDYVNEVKSIAKDAYSDRPVTEGELVELQKQVFYALDTFKDILIEYLD